MICSFDTSIEASALAVSFIRQCLGGMIIIIMIDSVVVTLYISCQRIVKRGGSAKRS